MMATIMGYQPGMPVPQGMMGMMGQMGGMGGYGMSQMGGYNGYGAAAAQAQAQQQQQQQLLLQQQQQQQQLQQQQQQQAAAAMNGVEAGGAQGFESPHPQTTEGKHSHPFVRVWFEPNSFSSRRRRGQGSRRLRSDDAQDRGGSDWNGR